MDMTACLIGVTAALGLGSLGISIFVLSVAHSHPPSDAEKLRFLTAQPHAKPSGTGTPLDGLSSQNRVLGSEGRRNLL
jgi:hypothetical protein